MFVVLQTLFTKIYEYTICDFLNETSRWYTHKSATFTNDIQIYLTFIRERKVLICSDSIDGHPKFAERIFMLNSYFRSVGFPPLENVH